MAASLREARRLVWGRHLRIEAPKDLASLAEMIKTVDPAKTEAIVVMGGDGTFHQVLRQIKSFPFSIPLFPFPIGTANDFATELGLTSDWLELQTLVDGKRFEPVDIVKVNGVPFVTTAGIGLGYTLTRTFNRLRSESKILKASHRLLGPSIYQALATATILFDRSYTQRIRVRTSHFDETVTSAAVFICNQSSMGGSFQVAPRIDNDDSHFNVLIAPSGAKLPLLFHMLQMRQQKLPHDFVAFSCSELEIVSVDGSPIGVFGDGEPITEARRLHFLLESKAIQVYRRKLK